MVLVAHLKHRAGINILVDFLVAATLKALAKVLVVDEILGRRECPTKRLSERTGVSRVTLVIEIERAVLAVRHDVAYPNSLRLVIHLVHPRLPSHVILTRYNCKICQSFSYVKRFHTNTSFRSSSRRQTVDICRRTVIRSVLGILLARMSYAVLPSISSTGSLIFDSGFSPLTRAMMDCAASSPMRSIS